MKVLHRYPTAMMWLILSRLLHPHLVVCWVDDNLCRQILEADCCWSLIYYDVVVVVGSVLLGLSVIFVGVGLHGCLPLLLFYLIFFISFGSYGSPGYVFFLGL